MWSALLRSETIPYRVVARTVLVLYDLQSVFYKVQYGTVPYRITPRARRITSTSTVRAQDEV